MDIQQLQDENAKLRKENRELSDRLKLMNTIYDSLSDGVVATRTDGEFLIANPTAIGIVGMSGTENPPEEWSEHYGTFYPDKITPFPSEELPLVQAMQGKVTNDVELFIRNESRPDGVFISVSGRPLHDESDDVIGGVILLRDITSQKDVESKLENTASELQSQSQLLNAVFNSVSDGIIVADNTGKYTYYNARAKEMGARSLYSLNIAKAPRRLGLFRPDGRTLFPVNELPLTRALLGESRDNVEMFIRNENLPDGMHVSVSGRPILDKKGFVTGGAAVIRDITRLKKTENRLRKTIDLLQHRTQLMKSIFNGMSDGVVVADEHGNFTMFNPSAQRYVGADAPNASIEEWPTTYGMFHTDKVTVFPPDEVPLARAINGESVDDIEMYVRNSAIPEGAYLSVNARPMYNQKGERQGGVVVFHDITHRIRAAEALAQAFSHGRLEVMDTILHNVGNAINSVAIGIDTLHNQLHDDELPARFAILIDALEAHRHDLVDFLQNHPQGRRVVPFIQALGIDLTDSNEELKRTVMRVRDKTNHIVDIIRTQKAHSNAPNLRKDVTLRDAFRGAVEILQDSLGKRNVKVDIDCGGAPRVIRIQESQFHQMIVNLVKNGIEAIDESVKSGTNAAPRIRIQADADSKSLRIQISDNGVGIDSDQQKQIFLAGYTTKTDGSGLGLHSSANFVIALGGKINVSSPGELEGTTIHITLPMSGILPTDHSGQQ